MVSGECLSSVCGACCVSELNNWLYHGFSVYVFPYPKACMVFPPLSVQFFCVVSPPPNVVLSWILSEVNNLASSSLQNEATDYFFLCVLHVQYPISVKVPIHTDTWPQLSQCSSTCISECGTPSWACFLHYQNPNKNRWDMEMETSNDKITCLQGKYQPSGAGGTRSPPAKSKMAASGPQNGRRGLERCPPLGFGAF